MPLLPCNGTARTALAGTGRSLPAKIPMKIKIPDHEILLRLRMRVLLLTLVLVALLLVFVDAGRKDKVQGKSCT